MKMNEHIIDSTNKSYGRLASEIAKVLIGKHRVYYRPQILPNEKVTVLNLDKVIFTGNKFEAKSYYKYSGYPGGIKETPLRIGWKKNPSKIFKKTVYDMLPKNKLRDKIIKNLIIK